MRLADHDARQRIAADLDATLVVEAAAGTGKTTALVGRIVSVVAQGHNGATLGKIIAVTFTQKAAGEMKLRLRQALEDERLKAAPGSPPHARLERALSELEVARIATIHEVCADLLREHPVAAGVDPMFEVAAAEDSAALLDAAFDGWFPQLLRAPTEGVRRLLRRRARRRDQLSPRALLRSAAWGLVEHRDFTGAWRRDAFERDAELERVLPALRALGQLANQGAADDFLRVNLAELRRFVEDLDHREAVAPRDHDGLEAAISELARHRSWTYKGWGADYARQLPRADVLQQRDAVKVQLDEVLRRANADLAACLHAELLPLVAAYEAVKARSGKLDFFDLLLRLRDLLQHNPAVRLDLQTRFTHLFVDEFQDTDPLQADILRLLASSDPSQTNPELAPPVPGKLFIVGDPKQSIYRFRRADVSLYERVKAGLLASGGALLDLTTSFRAAPIVQQAVNAAFAPQMGAGTQTQARYVPLTKFREPISHQPSLIALPVPRPYAPYGKITNQSIDESYPDAVGAFVDFLVRKSGWKVVEPGSTQPVAIQPQHICILFKRFKGWEGADVTQRYTRALEARRIPHVLVGGRSFHAREEVLALRNALTAVEWPDDELSVYATLRGPFFALSDDALLTFRAASGKLNPLRPLKSDGLPAAAVEVAEGLAVLKALHSGRNKRPIADTVSQLLEATRAHAGVAFWIAGDQALANLAQLTDLARRFEAAGGQSFRAFIDRLHADAEGGMAPEAPIVEEGSEGVRVMTVHGAKGLEFPVVILADPTAPHAGRRNPSHWVDAELKLWAEPLAGCSPVELLEHSEEVLRREREESIRLVYVAATRARDLLVVPVVGDAKHEGWVDVLHPVVYPKPEDARAARTAPGCPAFGSESVCERPERAPYGAVSIMPGLHTPEAGGHEVVWWDPRTLELDKASTTGLQQDEVLREDPEGVTSKAGLDAFAAWDDARQRLLSLGAQPALQVFTAREAPPVGPAGGPLLHESTGSLRTGRPGGRRFGTLVHAALSEVPLDAAAAEVSRVVMLKGRLLGSDPAELRAAKDAVAAALDHPLLRSAAKSKAVRRESPVALKLDDGTLAEGVIDLAFVEDGGGWVVIDFKTDTELDGHRAQYEAQVSVYLRAISQATGKSARGVLLSV